MWASGMLIGDLSGNPLYSKNILWIATLLVCSSYIFLLGPVFSFISKIRINKLSIGSLDESVAEKIGIILIFLQLGFMAFNFAAGVNIAGANTSRSNNPLALFWVAVPVDALFFIYYGFCRESPRFKWNLIVWILSNMMRGWSGMFLFVAFFEWCRAYRSGRISWRMVALVASIGILFYPVLVNIKWVFRLSATSGMSLETFFTSISNNLSSEDVLTIIGAGIEQVIGRLQVTSLVVEVARVQAYVQEEFARGAFTPFWLEGLHGIFIQKSLFHENYIPIGVAFTQYGDFSWQPEMLGDWNTNIGYVGWFFIAPHLIPFYLLYTISLGAIAVFLAKWIGWNETVKDMVWLAWLVYLLPPWFATFVSVIHAMLIFLVLKFFLSGFKRYSDTSEISYP